MSQSGYLAGSSNTVSFECSVFIMNTWEKQVVFGMLTSTFLVNGEQLCSILSKVVSNLLLTYLLTQADMKGAGTNIGSSVCC